MNKKYPITILIIIGGLCFSCSSTHWVYNNPHAYDQFNQTMQDRSVKIIKSDGSILKSDSVWVDTSGVFSVADSENKEVKLIFAEVEKIEYKNHGTGAVLAAFRANPQIALFIYV